MGLKSVRANGVATAYELSGRAGAPVVAFSNSLASDLGVWGRLLTAFPTEYRLLRYDLRGHGATEAIPGDYTVQALAGDFLALLDALGLERVHFVGLSLGGVIGQYLAATAAERVASLSLCATFAESSAGIWTPRIETARKQGLAPLLDATLTRWLTNQTRERRPDIAEATGRMIMQTSVEGYAGCAAALRDLNLTPQLSQIRCPTLLVAGSDDVAASPATMQAMSHVIEDSSFVALPRAAHMLAVERPLELAGLIGGFLERVR